jgi:hypothetical protein
MRFLREDVEDAQDLCAVHGESFLWDGVLSGDGTMAV